MLCQLLAADGDIVMAQTLGPGACEHIRVVREAMDSEAIDTRMGCGYRLTEIGLTECRRALAEVAAELVAASSQELRTPVRISA